MADSAKTLKILLPIIMDGVSALQVYMAYLEGCTAKDIDARTAKYVKFAQWVSDVGERFDYALLEKYGNYLRICGNAESTIKVKLSNIRQFLAAAEKKGLLKDCVYYAKRGRRSNKQTFVPTIIPNEEQTQEQPKSKRGRKKKVVETETTQESVQEQRFFSVEDTLHADVQKESLRKGRGHNGFKKTFLYDMFQIRNGVFSVELLKKAYRKLAINFHPDHTQGSQEQFLACKEAYEYLMDAMKRDSYNTYMKNSQSLNSSEISSFVHSIYHRVGGYSALNI